MVEQWSTEEPHKVNEGTTNYNTIDRSRSTCHHSTPDMALVSLDYRQHRHYDSHGHNRYNNYNRRSEHHNRPEADHRRSLLALSNTHNDSATVVINALESFSAKQTLAQSRLNAIQEFDGSDRELMLSWLEQVELVAERTGFDPLEVGISQLKGLVLGDISTIHKEEGLLWHKFGQCLIEKDSNVPYAPDAMFTY